MKGLKIKHDELVFGRELTEMEKDEYKDGCYEIGRFVNGSAMARFIG